MSLSLFTRESLFRQAADTMGKIEDYVKFNNRDIIISMYSDSAKILHGIEELVISNETLNDTSVLRDILFNNLQGVTDTDFTLSVSESFESRTKSQVKKGVVPYKEDFNFLLKAIATYQERLINAQYIQLNISSKKTATIQTFLSYAYLDKGLSLALFYYFLVKGGFLYVNWMWENANSNGAVTKKDLENALSQSEQLLFLRTANSELHLRGNHSIRQWCSWEIGNFYTKNPQEKYYVNFYDEQSRKDKNDILDSFNVVRDIIGGRCVR